MNRVYASGNETGVSVFVGNEVEKTPAYGMKTLFVVGLHDSEKLIDFANIHECTHIYFGANQSFQTNIDLRDWKQMISGCLYYGFWCTLDFDVSQVQQVIDSGLCKRNKFIPHISVKIPNLQQLNYNTTVKIDDTGFNATNPGVWCHRLHKLMNDSVYTNWDNYTSDEVLW